VRPFLLEEGPFFYYYRLVLNRECSAMLHRIAVARCNDYGKIH
jgi:hypothetical protein